MIINSFNNFFKVFIYINKFMMLKFSNAALISLISTLLVSYTWAKENYVLSETFSKLHADPFPQYATKANVKTFYIEQILDHFNATDTRTWRMRYFANSEFFENGGPIFIYVGGEWAIHPGTISGGHVYDMAKKYHGYLFYTEHRFYGESRPLPDLSVESLSYLSVQQSLADLAEFIKFIRKTIPDLKDSKVILIGGSYSGSMVTWFKKKYPNLVAGCWASSAPLHAYIDFWEYKDHMATSFKLVGEEACLKRIKNGISALENMLDNKKAGEVKAMLKLCDDFDELNDLDQWTLFYEISDLFAEVVQTHSNDKIQKTCKSIMNAKDDLSGVVNFVLSHINNTTCNDLTYEAALETVMSTTYVNHKRQWFYQTCNEFGWFQTSVEHGEFGTKYPVDYFTNMCYDAFGSKFTPAHLKRKADRINHDYGGAFIRIKNVYMTHGELDPWQKIGIMDDKQKVVIPLTAHCKDFESISERDSPELKASKEKISNLVQEWINTK